MTPSASRYFSPIELAENITTMLPENNLASKIQQLQRYFSEWDVEDAVPYRCDRIVFTGIEPCCNRWSVSSTGERCSPLQFCCHRFRFFVFNFQAANEVQEVLFCAIRTSHRVHLTHALRMFPHTLLPRRIFDLC